MSEFLDMGGYAAFVWPAYGAAAAARVVLLFVSLRTLRAREAELARAEGARGPRRQADDDA